MNITHLLICFLFPIFLFGQNQNTELKEIDSIVKTINETDKRFSEGIIEGPIIVSGLFKKNGGWGAYYLYDQQTKSIPIRIRYSIALRKTYESYEFYYLDGTFIFAKLNVNYYRKKDKDKSFERNYYFEGSELIFDSIMDMEEYNAEQIKKTESFISGMIFKTR